MSSEGSSSSWTDMDDDVSVSDDQESTISTPVKVVRLVREESVTNPELNDELTLQQVASMPYRRCRVSIFKKAGRFFYEPIVVLEEFTLSNKRRDGQQVAALTIKLWDYDLERRVITFLRNDIGEVGLKAHQVQMMPYEEVQLVAKNNTLRVPTGAVCLMQLPGEVNFEVSFSSEEEAELDAIAKFLAYHLELHFSSPSPRRVQATAKQVCGVSTFSVHRSSIFGINILSRLICSCEDEKAIAQNLLIGDVKLPNVDDHVKAIPNSVCVPVFRASGLLKISEEKRVTFVESTPPSATLHGEFNKTTGVFTVKSSGTYLFQFNSMSSTPDCVTDVTLMVNGVSKAGSPAYCLGACPEQDKSIDVCCVLHVGSGDQVWIHLENGGLNEASPGATRFCGIFLAGDSRD